MSQTGDASGLGTWVPKFESWKETAMPLLSKGKAKEAFSTYPWVTTEGDPFARLAGPASESRFALITTGGYSIDGVHTPFTGLPNLANEVPEVHTVPLDVDRSKLGINHHGYDHRFAKEDINVNLPLDRLVELQKAGEIGSVAEGHLRSDGTDSRRRAAPDRYAPAAHRAAARRRVDAVLLVPS